MATHENQDNEPIIFEQGKDPGEGFLRIVGNHEKMEKVAGERDITFREIHEVLFGKGRSIVVAETLVTKKNGDKEVQERQFKIVGLTNAGWPILVVMTPRDTHGLAKRVVTAWQASRKSDEVRKLLADFPDLVGQLAKE